MTATIYVYANAKPNAMPIGAGLHDVVGDADKRKPLPVITASS
jgi:hypothetical protein